MAVSRSDRNRSQTASASEMVFWDEIDKLRKEINQLKPRLSSSPIIVGHPTNLAAIVGGVAIFAVAVVGPAPLYYQWLKNGEAIAGAINPTLTIIDAGTADAGNYSVRVRNQVGEVESNQAQLTVTAIGADVPVGGILMWAGLLADIPANYALCDGGGGRPDLRSKFILGWAAGVDPGGTGGSTQHKHEKGTIVDTAITAGTPAGANSAPAFTGSPSTAASTAATPDLVAPDVTGTGVAPVTTPLGTVAAPVFTGTPLGTHQHTLTGKTADAENGAGSTASEDIYPPFYKLAFIQRVS